MARSRRQWASSGIGESLSPLSLLLTPAKTTETRSESDRRSCLVVAPDAHPPVPSPPPSQPPPRLMLKLLCLQRGVRPHQSPPFEGRAAALGSARRLPAGCGLRARARRRTPAAGSRRRRLSTSTRRRCAKYRRARHGEPVAVGGQVAEGEAGGDGGREGAEGGAGVAEGNHKAEGAAGRPGAGQGARTLPFAMSLF